MGLFFCALMVVSAYARCGSIDGERKFVVFSVNL